MKWWDQMPWSSFSECWALSQLFKLWLLVPANIALHVFISLILIVISMKYFYFMELIFPCYSSYFTYWLAKKFLQVIWPEGIEVNIQIWEHPHYCIGYIIHRDSVNLDSECECDSISQDDRQRLSLSQASFKVGPPYQIVPVIKFHISHKTSMISCKSCVW